MDNTAYDYWVCDECHRVFSRALHAQNTVSVQQRTEREFGTEKTNRPVVRFTVCDNCLRLYREAR